MEVATIKRMVCGGCGAPNAVGTGWCSKCGEDMDERATIRETPCPFCALYFKVDAIVEKEGIQDPPLRIGEEVVRYVDKEYLAFDALHSVSDFQINVIPRAHIESLSTLDASGTGVEDKKALLQRMHALGMEVASAFCGPDEVYELGKETFTVAFNDPPSVAHLHVYVIRLPYTRNTEWMWSSALCFPRAKTLAHVLSSLEACGSCCTGTNREESERTAHEDERARLVQLHIDRSSRDDS